MKSLNHTTSFKRPTAAETAPLWEEYRRTHDEGLRNRLAEMYLYIVQHRAMVLIRRLPREVDEGDLIQWGSVGLVKAVETFDPTRGFVFYTFANRRVMGAMLDGLRDTATYKRRALQQAKELAGAHDILQVELGRPPAPEEVAGHLKVDDSQYARMERHQAAYPLSLERAIEGSGREGCTGDFIPDLRAADPAAHAESADTMEMIIATLLTRYRLTEALVIRLYYLEEQTMKQAAR
jgi:RNA polymerase sigma factor for flagellar operon FliA